MKLRLQNIVLLLASMAYFFMRGSATKKFLEPRKAIIFQLAKMGDMVCTTPMFRAIKTKYPDCKVLVVGDRVNGEILQGNSDVDRYIVYKKNIMDIIKTLRQERIDFGCVTGPSPEALAMLYLSGIPLIAAPIIENGFSPQETRVYRAIRKFVHSVPHQMGHYSAREYLRLLECIGIFSSDTKKYLAYSPEALNRVRELFLSKNINPQKNLLAVIFPSTGDPSKKWGSEKFAALADYLVTRYHARIIVPGSSADHMAADEMIAYMREKNAVFNFVGHSPIEELKALVSLVSLVIAVDTGIIYIAEAFGIPTLDIAGPVDEREQPPRGECHAVVVPKREKPILQTMNTSMYDRVEARRQAEAISVEMVQQVLDPLMEKIMERREHATPLT